MVPLVTLLLCTHDPHPDRLRQTLAALEEQTVPRADWELLLIDNASPTPLAHDLVSWHPHGRVVRENRLGLTRARLRGSAEARSDLLVFCDDDNLLSPDYLATAIKLLAENPKLGAAGGKSLPRYEAPLPSWAAPFTGCLAIHDFGPARLLASWNPGCASDRAYPSFAPLGAGMILRRAIATLHAEAFARDPAITDRVGKNLSSGGDNALVLTALHHGWQVGYFPELSLTHLIPAHRLRLGYLARLNRASSESWVRLLAQHDICPWSPLPAWTVPLRQARAFFELRAWRGPAAYFQWAGACGLFAGRSKIDPRPVSIPSDQPSKKSESVHS